MREASFLRVTTLGRPQRGPYTGRGARTAQRRQDPLFSSLFTHRLCTHVATVTSTIEITTSTAESAFTSGVTAVFSIP